MLQRTDQHLKTLLRLKSLFSVMMSQSCSTMWLYDTLRISLVSSPLFTSTWIPPINLTMLAKQLSSWNPVTLSQSHAPPSRLCGMFKSSSYAALTTNWIAASDFCISAALLRWKTWSFGPRCRFRYHPSPWVFPLIDIPGTHNCNDVSKTDEPFIPSLVSVPCEYSVRRGV